MKQTIAGFVTVLLLGALLLAACADAGDQGAASGGAGAPPATTPRWPLPPSTGAGPRPGAARVVATGVVRDGVEAGCRLLVADSGPTYLLVGGDQDALHAGARVEVTGTLSTATASVCQQGRPLRVTTVRPA
jgi:hypothetical protein